MDHLLIFENESYIVGYIGSENEFAMLSENSDWEEAGRACQRLHMGEYVVYDPPDDDEPISAPEIRYSVEDYFS
jgi:hypothetical protein